MALFEPLFEITVRHDYYEDDYSRDFRLLPTDETQKLLSGHGMLFRSTSRGAMVLAQVEPDGSGGLKMARHPVDFFRYRFKLFQDKADFLNFTDLPFHRAGREIYYFNNLQANRDGNQSYLHATASRVAGGDRMPLLKGQYTRELSGSGDRKKARLLFPDKSISITREARKSGGSFTFRFDLDRFPEGRARFESGGTSESFYAMGEGDSAGLFGLIEIYHNASVPSSYRFVEPDGKLKGQNYTIWFGRRSTFWRYVVIDRTGQNLSDPGISGNGFTFSEDTPAGYPSHKKMFVSDQLIPFREEGYDSLSLTQRVNSSRKSVLDKLPNPGTESLKRDQNDPSKYYSDLYLYM